MPPKVEMTVEGRLKRIMVGLLGGPVGDPDPTAVLAAAHAWLLLRERGVVDAETEKDLRDFGGTDYIDLAERNVII